MKKVLATLLISFMLLGAGNLRAADFNYSNAYSGSMAGGMMSTMWDFMEWFLGRRQNNWRNPYVSSGWGGPAMGYGYPMMRNTSASNPYRYRDYWDDPNNPWVGMQPLEGTWLAQSGEYWYVRGKHFVLLDTNGNKSGGEFYVEGDFILARMRGIEVEFEYRQMDDVLILRDVNGRIMLLRRVEAGGWNW